MVCLDNKPSRLSVAVTTSVRSRSMRCCTPQNRVNMFDRTIVLVIVAAVLMSVLASTLPRITPSLVALGLLVLIARLVWFYTR